MKIYSVVKSAGEVIQLQNNLDRIASWCDVNNLKLNVNKCNFMTFSKKTSIVESSYSVNGINLSKVTTTCDLGITFDSAMTFTTHIENICTSATRMLGFIFRVSRQFQDINILKSLYSAFVLSKMEYWNPVYLYQCMRLEGIQRKFLKFLSFRIDGIYPGRGFPHQELLQRHTVMSLAERRELSSIGFLSKLIRLLSWDLNNCLVDLEKELAILTEQALEGEEARYGERLIQFASENLVTEILIHPVVSTLAQCVRNLLSSFTRHRHIIHAGYTFAHNGSWVLQDGTFSLTDFSEAFQEIEVLRVIRAYENGISLDIHCAPEGDWPRLPKEPFTKGCNVHVNPNDVLTAGSPAITSFINYIEPFLVPAELEHILESSEVVGNIRFSRPTLYVFPGGQGDAALFGINGFNMLLDGGFSRKACFWDFVRHLDRLDAVLLTRLNNGNVNGISAVLKRKRQNALYPQIGHFFCNIQERKAILSPDGDKDKDPLLINLLEEGQDIVSNLKHLGLTPQVCYRDSEPINLYHKVGHGTLDMYVLSPAKDSKEVREFLQKWNNNDQKLFASYKSKDFAFPLQNIVSICALLVWQPANPEDTITRILFPGSSPQNKIFEGLDRVKSLEFIKHPVCSEKTLAPTAVIKTKTGKDSVIDKILPPTAAEKKLQAVDNKKEKAKPTVDNVINGNELKNGDISDVPVEKTVKKSDSTESERSISKPKKIIENGDKAKPKPKVDPKSRLRSESQQRKVRVAPEKKSPKKTVDKVNEDAKDTKPPVTKTKASPTATPAKSTKEANNRKVVVESKIKTAPKKEPPPATTTKPVSEKKEVKIERKPISRRPRDPSVKLAASPSKKVNGIQKPDTLTKRGKLDKEVTTDSSTVSTPSADQDSVLNKKDISKMTTDELLNLKDQELAELKEEQEAVKEIEAVFRKGELQDDRPSSDFRKIKDLSIDDKLENEEYIIIEKTEIVQETSQAEDETQKHARDSEESEKRRKLSDEDIKKPGPTEEEEAEEEHRQELQDEVQKIITSAADAVKAKEEVEASKEVSVTSPEDKVDVSTDKRTDKDNEDEIKEPAPDTQPDEKGSANIESGATTTAPTLPEDERIPLDEIKEMENGDQVIEEKHVKEDTKEKDSSVPVIQLPPKTFENITTTSPKLPPVVGIRLDKQSHIRDIVKTPDEVADLPVHEEVDYVEYTSPSEAKVATESHEKPPSEDDEKQVDEVQIAEAEVKKEEVGSVYAKGKPEAQKEIKTSVEDKVELEMIEKGQKEPQIVEKEVVEPTDVELPKTSTVKDSRPVELTERLDDSKIAAEKKDGTKERKTTEDKDKPEDIPIGNEPVEEKTIEPVKAEDLEKVPIAAESHSEKGMAEPTEKDESESNVADHEKKIEPTAESPETVHTKLAETEPIDVKEHAPATEPVIEARKVEPVDTKAEVVTVETPETHTKVEESKAEAKEIGEKDVDTKQTDTEKVAAEDEESEIPETKGDVEVTEKEIRTTEVTSILETTDRGGNVETSESDGKSIEAKQIETNLVITKAEIEKPDLEATEKESKTIDVESKTESKETSPKTEVKGIDTKQIETDVVAIKADDKRRESKPDSDLTKEDAKATEVELDTETAEKEAKSVTEKVETKQAGDEEAKTGEVDELVIKKEIHVLDTKPSIADNKQTEQLHDKPIEDKPLASIVDKDVEEAEKRDDVKAVIVEEIESTGPIEKPDEKEKSLGKSEEKHTVAKAESIPDLKDDREPEIIEKSETEIKEKESKQEPSKHEPTTGDKLPKDIDYKGLNEDFDDQKFPDSHKTNAFGHEMDNDTQELDTVDTQIAKDKIKTVKETNTGLTKLDEKLQMLKEQEGLKRVQEFVTVDRKVEEPLHAESVVITGEEDSKPESPSVEDKFHVEDKMELGQKSPKEREEDVAKIVASVAEVLKSDAPLEEFEGKIPFALPYQTYTTELRETHITTVESPVTEVAKILCPKSSSAAFLDEERKLLGSVDEEPEILKEEKPESKISKMMKDSNDLIQASSRIISDIKQTQPSTTGENVEDSANEDQEEEVGTVHRMLVTASSEDGGEETEICPVGTIIFSKSSESSGRSSPDPLSQKVSQKSSIAETISDTITTKTVRELQSGKDSGIDEDTKATSDTDTSVDKQCLDRNLVETEHVREVDVDKEAVISNKPEPRDNQLADIGEIEAKKLEDEHTKAIAGISDQIERDVDFGKTEIPDQVDIGEVDTKELMDKLEGAIGERQDKTEVADKSDIVLGKAKETNTQERGIVDEAVSQVVQQVEHKLGESGKQTDEAKTVIDGPKDTIDSLTEDVKKHVEEDGKKVTDLASSLINEAEETFKVFKDSISHTVEGAKDAVDGTKTKAADEVSALMKDAKAEVQAIRDSASHKIDDVKHSVEETEQKALDTTKETLHDVEDTIIHKTEEVKGSLEETEKEMTVAASNLVNVAKTSIDGVEESIGQKVDEAKQSLEDTKQEIQETLGGLVGDAREGVVEVKDSISEKVDEAKQCIGETKEKARDFLKGLVEDAYEKVDKADDFVVKKTEDAKQTVAETKEQTEHALKDLISDVQKEVDNVDDSISQKLDEAKHAIDDIKSKEADIASNLSKETKKTTEHIVEESSGLFGPLKDTLSDIKGSASGKIGEIKDALVDEQHAIVDKAKLLMRDVEQKVDEVEKTVTDVTSDLKSDTTRRETEKIVESNKSIPDKSTEISKDPKDELHEGIEQKVHELSALAAEVENSVESHQQLLEKAQESEKPTEQPLDDKFSVYNGLEEVGEMVVDVVTAHREESPRKLSIDKTEQKSSEPGFLQKLGGQIESAIEDAAEEVEEIIQESKETVSAVFRKDSIKEEEKVLEKTATDIEENYEILSDMTKSVVFDKCELSPETKLEKTARDLEENFEVVSDMAQSVVFEKCEVEHVGKVETTSADVKISEKTSDKTDGLIEKTDQVDCFEEAKKDVKKLTDSTQDKSETKVDITKEQPNQVEEDKTKKQTILADIGSGKIDELSTKSQEDKPSGKSSPDSQTSAELDKIEKVELKDETICKSGKSSPDVQSITKLEKTEHTSASKDGIPKDSAPLVQSSTDVKLPENLKDASKHQFPEDERLSGKSSPEVRPPYEPEKESQESSLNYQAAKDPEKPHEDQHTIKDELEELIERGVEEVLELVTDTQKAVASIFGHEKPSDDKEVCEITKSIVEGEPTESGSGVPTEKTATVPETSSKQIEDFVERSAHDIEDNFQKVSDMTQSIIFEKCDLLDKKSDEALEIAPKQIDDFVERSAHDIVDNLQKVTDLSQSIIFEKCDPSTEKTDMRSTLTTGEQSGKKLSISEVQISVEPEKELIASFIEQEKLAHADVDITKATSTVLMTSATDILAAGPSSSESKDQSLALAAKSSIEELSLSGKSTPDIADVERIKEMQETLKHEKHIPGSSTPPTVPVSPIVKDVQQSRVLQETKTAVASLKESDYFRSSTPGSDDLEIAVSTHSDISSGQISRAPHLLESERIESDDEDVAGSPLSITSQVAHSRSSSHYDFDDDNKIQSSFYHKEFTDDSFMMKAAKMDPMQTSFYGALPDDDPDAEFEKALQEHKETRGEDLVLGATAAPTYLYEITRAKYGTASTLTASDTDLDQINKNGTQLKKENDLMTSSFYGGELPSAPPTTRADVSSWGKPLGLPSPAPPTDNRGTPKKEKKLPANVTAKNKLNDDRKRSESPSKYKNKKLSPVYVDLTYVPHHGNAYYAYIDFFKRIRARYYVFSGIEPSREVYNALLEAKQTWEDKDLEVTIIPTYDTDTLGYWVAENEELLTKYKIDLSPSASRCTINLQDHETSCSAYRLEF